MAIEIVSPQSSSAHEEPKNNPIKVNLILKPNNPKRPLESDSTPPSSIKKKKSCKESCQKELDKEDPALSAKFKFEQGLRKVQPYYFIHQTYAKGRWIGRTLLSVFEKEFSDKPKSYYQSAIETGKIQVNRQAVDINYVLQQSDLVTHSIHRHEPPVTDEPIKILGEKNGYLAIRKPSSIPIHPTGRYFHNTVLHILRKEHHLSSIRALHRLDRLTSGLLILASNKDKAKEFHSLMEKNEIKKKYVCRVKGEFPKETVVCTEAIKVFSNKHGLCAVNKDGRPCKTSFERLSFNGKSSVVLCQPQSGRMHQIRVHLQFLGYPIVNDPLYGNILFWGDTLGKGGVDEEELMKVLEKKNANLTKPSTTPSVVDVIDSNCPDCLFKYPDPSPDQLCIWLHAFEYSFGDTTFTDEFPAWAQPNFVEV